MTLEDIFLYSQLQKNRAGARAYACPALETKQSAPP